jgi:hypothetical protein
LSGFSFYAARPRGLSFGCDIKLADFVIRHLGMAAYRRPRKYLGEMAGLGWALPPVGTIMS